MKDEKYFCDLTERLFRYYILEPTKEHFEEMFSYFSQELIMIGTGKHEFYTKMNQIAEGFRDNLVEALAIELHVLDEWYECIMLSQDIYLVYGGIWVRQQECDIEDPLVEMDTRFSVVYRKQGEKVEMVHLHHSVPYAEQQSGEYYPKTLSEKAKAAMNLAMLFKKKSEIDLLTEVYNNVSFKHNAIKYLETCNNGVFYLFDLDYFKHINDTYGHTTGDELLKLFSALLKESFAEMSVVGRVGGDEFAVFEYEPLCKADTIKKITEMQKTLIGETKKIMSQGSASFSVGIVSATNGKNLYEDIFANADNALYHAKRIGRKTHYWHGD